MTLIIHRAPDAVAVLRFIEKNLSVKAFELIGRVDVKEEQPAGHEEQVDPLKGPPQLFRVGDIVDAVQTAHAGVDGAIQVQLIHALAQKNGGDPLRIPVLFCGLGQHVGGEVHPDHLISPQGQLAGEGAGAAGQIQHSGAGQARPFKVALDVFGPGGVVHIGGELIVAAGQKSIAVHS